MLADWVSFVLSNFDLAMFVLAIFFMLLNRVVTQGRVPQAEIVFRWLALFSLGFTGFYAAIMHAYFPEIAAGVIGWTNSPFQYEVAAANAGFGAIGLLSFNASYGFRMAAVLGNTLWLWGDAAVHMYQLINYHNYSIGNAGSWFWMDMLLPVMLIICMTQLKRRPK